MERRDKAHSDLFHGAGGYRSQYEFDDFRYGRMGGSYQSFGDEARWKNAPRAQHYNNDHFGYGNRERRWSKHLDNQETYRESHYGKGPKNYKRSDKNILADANEVLTYSHIVDATHIEVSVQDGVVTLGGTVLSRKMKREAEYLMESIPGVVDVLNLLRPIGEPVIRNENLKT